MQSQYAYQIIPYCIRPSEPELFRVKHDTLVKGRSITFNELHANNISSQQLITWSASIDIAEQYQACEGFDTGVFYNCTWPTFGHYCQYSLYPSNESFSDVVHYIFVSKDYQRSDPVDYTSYSCYTHVECDRGPVPMCLDWREICDNHIDCLNGSQDEENCFLLELNECADDEFRCQNGMCISNDFFHDDELNPDCLDGTDEYQTFLKSEKCYQDPAFRCSELSPPYGLGFSCGDDTCTSNYALPSIQDSCKNGRDFVFSKAIWSYANHNTSLSLICWSAMICLHNLNGIDDLDCDYYCDFDECLEIARDHCPSLFFFPNYQMFGHVRFLYSSNISTFVSLPVPDYVCYNYELCDFLKPTTFRENLTCLLFENFGFNEDIVLQWNLLFMALYGVFHGCSSTYSINHEQFCQAENVFRCPNSSKCISKHRLIDGFQDCYEDIDEMVNNSCNLQNKHRYRCSSQNKCVQSWLMLNGIRDCINGEDELEYNQHEQRIPVAFTNICDGFIDSIMITDKGHVETDETNCEEWQCDNHYTHCDGVWNCVNGVDEIACESSRCAPNEHPCISSRTYKPICLLLTQAGDGQIDCLGSYDERSYCRELKPMEPKERYRCQNSSECASAPLVCRFPNLCPNEDKQSICQTVRLGEESLEKLHDGKRLETYFSLSTSDSPDENLTPSSDHSITSNPSQTWNDVFIGNKMIRELADVNYRRAWFCNRGIPIYNHERHEDDCLCPSSHYGDRCQYQNQRVSLTIRFYKENAPHLWHTLFYFSIMLIDEEQNVHSYDYITYLPTRDCTNKYNFNLLYKARPKDERKNYSIHIDAFFIDPLAYHTSWYLSIPFQFLPVNRLAKTVVIPVQGNVASTSCPIKCNHGRCFKYENIDKYFCRCDAGWYGLHCQEISVNQCSFDSIFYGTYNNRSMCVCPIGKFGLRCLLTSVCQSNPCQKGGSCVPDDARVSQNGFTCLCSPGFSGTICNNTNTKINIYFEDIPIPSAVLVHFITVNKTAEPAQTSIVKNVPADKKSVEFYASIKFNLLFIEIQSLLYLVILQRTHAYVETLTRSITTNHRCPSVHELLKPERASLPFLKRVKFYHALCRKHNQIKCFHDDVFLCLCTLERYSNCFEFNQNLTRKCRANIDYCENGAQCFHDRPNCPSTLVCLCDKCYFGSRCQLSTKGLGLSLDAILGYKILPKTALRHQSIAIKMIIMITTLMFVIGFISAFLSFITFQAATLRETGCCIYLLASSISSFLTTIFFSLKLWLLVFSQMSLITHRSFLFFQCIMIDFLLSIFLAMNNWFNACVAVERAVIVLKGVNFNKKKSQQSAKWITLLVTLLAVLSYLHDPIHRRLIDGLEEHRIWCVASYPTRMDIFNSTINFLHFFIPLCTNVIFALVIILTIARQRAILRTNETYSQHIYQQLQEHKHLLISPCILVILALPRVIIAFSSSCMTSARDPWLFLIGYYISFISTTVTFVIFVLPSQVYKKQCRESISRFTKSIRQRLRSYYSQIRR